MLHPPTDQFQHATCPKSLRPDVELLELGTKLCTAVEAVRLAEAKFKEDDDEWPRLQTALDASHDVVKQIEKISATTLEGLCVKARALHHLHQGEPVDDRFFSTSEGGRPTTDLRVAAGILCDLLNMTPDWPISDAAPEPVLEAAE